MRAGYRGLIDLPEKPAKYFPVRLASRATPSDRADPVLEHSERIARKAL
jgi:hypothetical protein